MLFWISRLPTPPNVRQLFFSLPVCSILPHQGDVGIPGEQGEIGFKGDKVDHQGNRHAVRNVLNLTVLHLI